MKIERGIEEKLETGTYRVLPLLPMYSVFAQKVVIPKPVSTLPEHMHRSRSLIQIKTNSYSPNVTCTAVLALR